MRAAAHGALLRQHGLKGKLAWVWGQRWRGFVAALCCDPGPLRASMRICRPLALNLQARATRSGIEASCPVRGRVASPTACEAKELAVLPPTSAMGGVPHVLSAWACGERDQRRAYAYGLSERAGYATSSGTKPRSVVPRPTQFPLSARVEERLLRARRPSASRTQPNEGPGEKRAQSICM